MSEEFGSFGKTAYLCTAFPFNRFQAHRDVAICRSNRKKTLLKSLVVKILEKKEPSGAVES